MAELAMAAFGSLMAAGPAAAPAAGMALGLPWAGVAMPAMSTVASVMQGVATGGSVLSQLMQARQARLSGDAAQIQGNLDANVALLEGERAADASAARAVELRREAVKKAAAARVAFAGSGLDVSSGQLAGIEADIGNERDYGLSFEAINQRIAGEEAALHAARYRARGENARLGAQARAAGETVGAVTTGARGLLSIARRG